MNKKVILISALLLNIYNTSSYAMMSSLHRIASRAPQASRLATNKQLFSTQQTSKIAQRSSFTKKIIAVGVIGAGISVYWASNATTRDINAAICGKKLIKARCLLKARQLIKKDDCPLSKLTFPIGFNDSEVSVWNSIRWGIACGDVPGYVPLLTDRNDTDGLNMLLIYAATHSRPKTVEAILATKKASATSRYDGQTALAEAERLASINTDAHLIGGQFTDKPLGTPESREITKLLHAYIKDNPALHTSSTPKNNESSI